MKKRNVDLEENIKNQKEKKGDGVEKLTLSSSLIFKFWLDWLDSN